VFESLCQGDEKDPQAIAERRGLLQIRDTGATQAWVDAAIAGNPQAVSDYKNNPKKKQASLGFLRGAVMKLSQGKADPKMVGELLENTLGKDS
jgi:aspartyl-tRNA(Asn)/glutamyl-tRNA(Gln) amidotransferase subunit B